MIHALHATILAWLNRRDLKKIEDRVRDCSASGTWVVRATMRINERRDRIDGLRAPQVRYSLRGAR